LLENAIQRVVSGGELSASQEKQVKKAMEVLMAAGKPKEAGEEAEK
jgi:hypothetical protein